MKSVKNKMRITIFERSFDMFDLKDLLDLEFLSEVEGTNYFYLFCRD